MVKKTDEIQDDELRVIGHPAATNTGAKPKGRRWLIVAAVAAIIAVAAALVIVLGQKEEQTVTEPETVQEVFDPAPVAEAPEAVLPLGDYADTTGKAYTEHLQMSVNDIPLDVYIPHNAEPKLSIGTPDIHDRSIILVTQAADIRADNGKINGAFVLAGEPKAWGLSKKGYVGIIDGKVTVGVADNSPLFEEATEKGGYFFRQYALVDNGALVENAPKGKAVRKAICDRAGEIIVVMSQTPESFHDFAQALIDMRVANAVYLVGADSYGYFRDKFDHFTQIYEKRRGGYKYENYIKWGR